VIITGGARFGARRAQFEPVWNRDLFRAVHRTANIPVFAVGGIRSAGEARAIVEGGEADFVGIGRPFYAEPDLPARVLADDPGPRLCQNSNRCVPAQLLGMKGACYNPEVRKRRQA
jgi:2,4-dienoyl-CoA reductase-like NADH-dependent reductase (Old Yellow Enzyme family)